MTVKESSDRSTNSAVGLIAMFAVGLLAGFFGRPLIMEQESSPVSQPQTVVVTATPDPNQAVAAVGSSNQGEKEVVEIVVTATPSPTPDIMAMLLADARHSQGAEDAPVTIIEFSDFK